MQIKPNAELRHYIQLKRKSYFQNEELRVMIQLVDVSQSILYEQVHSENQFLAITNATVSHELRNPLQSISA
jgi:signal transduction histidine kinase